jgi:hypothetical protein
VPEQPPEVYTDIFRFTLSPYGIALTFGVNEPHPNPGKPAVSRDEVIIRMSLEQAKVLSMMLRRNLKRYERENGLTIALPYQLYTSLGIAEEDWADGGTTG